VPDTPPPLNTQPSPQATPPTEVDPTVPKEIVVKEFRVKTGEDCRKSPAGQERKPRKQRQAFSQKQINEITQDFLNRPLSFAEVMQAADVIAQFYLSKGYIISGSFIPAGETEKDGIVSVCVVTDRIREEDIRVRFVKPVSTKDDKGATRTEYISAKRNKLRESYIRKRLAIAAAEPLNRQKLLEALQLLKLNPLIQDVQADLSPGTQPGQSLLDVKIVEVSRSWGASVLLDNGRSPSVGTFRQQFQFREGNLLGFGDALALTYSHTRGSNTGDFSYTFPINPRNGTLKFNFGIGASKIIEEPFDFLDIRSKSRYLELTYRQPIILTPTRELALGVTLSRQYTRATLVDGEIPFPVPGSDFEGKTRITALRFVQDWQSVSDRSVLALRSQFSLGLPFASTDNEEPPDARFISWQGQAQWARLLAPDTELSLTGNIQFANRALVPVEQFGLGGFANVRGYRQDAVLGDNGLFASAELKIPVLRLYKDGQVNSVLQVAPFVDVGSAWKLSDTDDDSVPNTLAAVGLGLRFQISDRLQARLDWGIPLVSIENTRNTLQERGVYFSLFYRLF
jgi:hemolysin activation/secretion protein